MRAIWNLKTFRAGALTMLVSLVLASGCSAGADEASGEDGVVRYPAGAPVIIDSVSPYSVTPKEQGYWDGLDVDLQPVKGGTEALQLMAAGQGDITTTGSSSIYQQLAKNPDMKVIAYLNKNIWQTVVPEGSPITSMEDLKGKTIGTQSLSSASYLMGRAAIAASGLDPDNDVQWLSVGVGNQAAAAFQDGTIDALASYDGPSAVVGLALGEKLVNLPTPIDEIKGSLAWVVTDSFLEEHRDTVVKFIQGVFKGYYFAAANPAATLQIHWSVYPDQKPSGKSTEDAIATSLPGVESRYSSAIETGSSQMLGELSEEEVQKGIDFMLEQGIINKPLEASEITDFSLLDEINDFDSAAITQEAKTWKP